MQQRPGNLDRRCNALVASAQLPSDSVLVDLLAFIDGEQIVRTAVFRAHERDPCRPSGLVADRFGFLRAALRHIGFEYFHNPQVRPFHRFWCARTILTDVRMLPFGGGRCR